MCQIARIHVRIDLFVGPDLDPRCLRGSSADKTNHAKNNKLLCRICMRSHECIVPSMFTVVSWLPVPLV